MLLVGTAGNPLVTLCEQTGCRVHTLDRSMCPLYDGDAVLPAEVDASAEARFNKMMDNVSEQRAVRKGKRAMLGTSNGGRWEADLLHVESGGGNGGGGNGGGGHGGGGNGGGRGAAARPNGGTPARGGGLRLWREAPAARSGRRAKAESPRRNHRACWHRRRRLHWRPTPPLPLRKGRWIPTASRGWQRKRKEAPAQGRPLPASPPLHRMPSRFGLACESRPSTSRLTRDSTERRRAQPRLRTRALVRGHRPRRQCGWHIRRGL